MQQIYTDTANTLTHMRKPNMINYDVIINWN